MRRFCFFLMCMCLWSIASNAQEVKKELQTEKDGFQWYKLRAGGIYGAEDKDGNEIIPLSRGYTYITYYTDSFMPKIRSVKKANDYVNHPEKYYEEGYFSINKNSRCGACNVKGEEIVSPLYTSCSRHGDKGKWWYEVQDEKWHRGACDATGRIVIIPSKFYQSIIYSCGNFEILPLGASIYGGFVPTKVSMNSKGKAKGVVTEEDFWESKQKTEARKAKRQKRWERMDKVQNALGAVGTTLNAVGTSMQSSSTSSDGTDSSVGSSSSRTSSSKSSKSSNCSHCHGSRRCGAPKCNGQGFWYVEGSKVYCPKCQGSAICTYCHGRGKM